MAAILVTITQDHSLVLVVFAISICVVSAWLFMALLERVAVAPHDARLQWMACSAGVVGLGVWATHFIAALGYRPDFALSFDPTITAGSAIVGVGAVGVPASVTAFTQKPVRKLMGGATAGAGIVAMHTAGMSALTTCTVQQPYDVVVGVAIVGAALFSAALLVPVQHRWYGIALLVLAVGIVHFGLLAGSQIVFYQAAESGIGRGSLSLVTGTVALCLLLAAYISVRSSTKIAEQVRQKTLLSTALTNMSNGLVLIGSDDRIELFNDRVLELFGLKPGAIAVGMQWQRYLENLAIRLGWNPARLERVIRNHERWFGLADTTYLEHSLDDGRILSVACRPVGSGGAVITYDDVTAERQAQKEVEHLAFQDPLTGLPNRRTFQNTIKRVCEDRAEAVLLLIDLDHFKVVNDTLGHTAGDELLIEVGRRLLAICNRGEHVARMAGDEFAIISPDMEPEQTRDLCDRLIAGVSRPYVVAGRSMTIGCSVGTSSTADADTAECLIQFADLALYRAKIMGRGHSQRYEPGMREAALHRSLIENDLRAALQHGQFALLYQPIYQLEDRTVIGFEALIRWYHPVRGLVSPAEFIPIAEESGLICEIGLWIAREACRQVACWPDHIHVAINVSPVQFRGGTFPQQLIALVNDAGIAPARIEIELTETALVGDNQQIADGLRAVHASGIRIAMDDFGTGYSSFAHLRDFDLDWIKIDQSFVRSAPDDPSSAAILQAVVHMAEGLGVGTIAEGVETEEQLATLRQAGCTAVQGYLLGHPMAGKDAGELIGLVGPEAS